MKYNGIELQEFTSDKTVVFDKPRKMLVWDDCNPDLLMTDTVYAYLVNRHPKVQGDKYAWQHCAEIPELPKPLRATNLELMKWLAQGKGILKISETASVYTKVDDLNERILGNDCPTGIVVRKWEDKEWHEPTVDYMGLEGLDNANHT